MLIVCARTDSKTHPFECHFWQSLMFTVTQSTTREVQYTTEQLSILNNTIYDFQCKRIAFYRLCLIGNGYGEETKIKICAMQFWRVNRKSNAFKQLSFFM
jgi:hypothetical protein